MQRGIAIGLILGILLGFFFFFDSRLTDKAISDKDIEVAHLEDQLHRIAAQQLPAFRLPDSITFCGNSVDLTNPFIYRRVKRETNSIIFREGTLGQLIDMGKDCFPVVERILTREGLPGDLKYLVPVESNFNFWATSYAGARGPWQFMKSAAHQYGLQFHDNADERLNLDKATEAACKYLKNSYRVFGDWLLTVTAYNKGDFGLTKVLETHGLRPGPEETNGDKGTGDEAGELERAMMDQGDSNFWHLVLLVKCKSPKGVEFYSNEQERYAPRVLAMKIIFESLGKFDFYKLDSLDVPPPTQTVRVVVQRDMRMLEIARNLSYSLWDLKYINPEYIGPYPEIRRGQSIHLPANLIKDFQERLNIALPAPVQMAAGSTPEPMAAPPAESPDRFLSLKKNETIWDIAKRNGISMKDLLALNSLDYTACRTIKPGFKVRVR
ncbi:MAG: transglycosylase SLT domain-containing protein [Deltaproteobacteria bacterium]|nr:transglycosylase SLT domain-containing protein [Deltaproteobacteria bacterium]